MPHTALYLLDLPRIERDGEPISVDTRKAIALGAYLAISGKSHSREALTLLFWPDSDTEHARSALRRTLTALRKALGAENLETAGDYLALKPDANLWIDADYFLRQVSQCQRHGHAPEEVCPACIVPLSEAANLYQKDFLAGFTLSDCPDFDDWQYLQRESFRREYASVLKKLVEYYLGRRELQDSLTYAQRLLTFDPLDEHANLHLMELYAWSGQRASALRQFEYYKQLLEREMEVEPGEEIQALHEAILNDQFTTPSIAPIERPHTNLPQQPTPFIGRETEIGEVLRLLGSPECRLLTLVGPGGMGKTRLALQSATQMINSFSDGVYFVPLASIESSDLLAPAVAASVNLALHGPLDTKEQLLNYLRGKDMLIILDNFEQLLVYDSTGLLVEILSRVNGIKLLVTSRERLNLKWEWFLELQGLGFPQENSSEPPETYSAVQLFIESARRIDRSFVLEDEDLPHIFNICRTLNGLPLGIELAAAWIQIFSCREIAAEIENSLDFLKTTRRDVPERHRSLQAVFTQSWNRLSEEEARVLRRLSVLRGGFQREAAGEVASAPISILSSLMDKSFIQRDSAGRYFLHEVLRQYALEQLQKSPLEEENAYLNAYKYYSEFLSLREKKLNGWQQLQALNEIAAEIDNLHTIWHWAGKYQHVDLLDQMLTGLAMFYEIRGWINEGIATFSQAAKAIERSSIHPGTYIELVLGRFYVRLGWLYLKRGQFDQGAAVVEKAHAIFTRLEARTELGQSFSHLGYIRAVHGNPQEAIELINRSIEIRRETNDLAGIAGGLNNLGLIASIQGDQARAKEYLLESLLLRKKNGNRWGMVYALSNLGLVSESMHDFQEAQRYHKESAAIAAEIGDRWQLTLNLNNLGFTLLALEEMEEARQCFTDALRGAVELQLMDAILEALTGFASLMAGTDDEGALELVTCVLQHETMLTHKPKERAEKLLDELRARLPAEKYLQTEQMGRLADYEKYVGRYLRN